MIARRAAGLARGWMLLAPSLLAFADAATPSLPLGRLLRLDDATRATRLSPIAQPRPQPTRIAFAVGEGESDAFKAQSAALAATWQAPAPLICPGHHFSMLEGLNGGALLDLALLTAEGRGRRHRASRCALP